MINEEVFEQMKNNIQKIQESVELHGIEINKLKNKPTRSHAFDYRDMEGGIPSVNSTPTHVAIEGTFIRYKNQLWMKSNQAWHLIG